MKNIKLNITMKKRIRYLHILSLIIVLVFSSCQKNQTEKTNSEISLQDLTWLVGTWKNETSRGDIFESWQMVDDSLLNGVVYRVSNLDTTLLENLSIQNIKDDLFYIPVVEHNKGAVYFKLIDHDTSKFVFENPEHDYPQRIIYFRIDSDSLHARIEGEDNGNFRAVDFYFQRDK